VFLRPPGFGEVDWDTAPAGAWKVLEERGDSLMVKETRTFGFGRKRSSPEHIESPVRDFGETTKVDGLKREGRKLEEVLYTPQSS
jgi:hypothetical protein